MATASSARQSVRFGTFEVDLEAAELRHKGLLIKIQEQPFRVLAAMLERPGEIVTREQLRERLWASDTFVDFDHSVNAAIKKLRRALRDDADSPRFIETIPKRGYRFIAPIEAHDVTTEMPPESPRATGKIARRWLIAAGAVAVVAVGVLAVALFLRSSSLRKPVHSIAVLPLVNLSSDPEQEYFSDGMTDELITALARNSGLLVISHTSVERYKATKRPLPVIARELGVDAVVEGRVLRAAGRVRISAQLIDTRTDRHIWAESYEGDLRDVLLLQDNLARRIAAQVGAKLNAGARMKASEIREVNPAAQEAYMEGNFYWNRLTCADFSRALGYFQQAVDRDQNFALAYVGLAQSYFTLDDWGCTPEAHTIPKSKAAALKAAELDPSLGAPHAWLGKIAFFYEWNWSEAEKDLNRAIELDPNYVYAHLIKSVFLVARGQQQQGFTEMRRALELDPTSALTNVVSTVALYLGRQYERAIAQGKKTVELYPNSPASYSWLALVYEQNGMDNEAIAAYLAERSFAGQPASEVAAYRKAYRQFGMRGYWELVLAAAQKGKQQSTCGMAAIYAHVGAKDKTLAALNQEFREDCSGMQFLNVDPLYDGVRDDPRFQDLMHRLRM